MLAERFIPRADREGRLTNLPAFPPGEELEIIVLRRKPAPPSGPSPKLRGSAHWVGNTAVLADDTRGRG